MRALVEINRLFLTLSPVSGELSELDYQVNHGKVANRTSLKFTDVSKLDGAPQYTTRFDVMNFNPKWDGEIRVLYMQLLDKLTVIILFYSMNLTPGLAVPL